MTIKISNKTILNNAGKQFCIYKGSGRNTGLSCAGATNEMTLVIIHKSIDENLENIDLILNSTKLIVNGEENNFMTTVNTGKYLAQGRLPLKNDGTEFDLPDGYDFEWVHFRNATNQTLRLRFDATENNEDNLLILPVPKKSPTNNTTYYQGTDKRILEVCLAPSDLSELVCDSTELYAELQYEPRTGTVSENGHVLLTVDSSVDKQTYSIPIGNDEVNYSEVIYKYFLENPINYFTVVMDYTFAIPKLTFFNNQPYVIKLKVEFDENIKNTTNGLTPIIFNTGGNTVCITPNGASE